MTWRQWRDTLGDLATVGRDLTPAAVWRRRRAQRDCYHHDPKAGTSWLRSELIDTGRGKATWCTVCRQCWIV